MAMETMVLETMALETMALETIALETVAMETVMFTFERSRSRIKGGILQKNVALPDIADFSFHPREYQDESGVSWCPAFERWNDWI